MCYKYTWSEVVPLKKVDGRGEGRGRGAIVTVHVNICFVLKIPLFSLPPSKFFQTLQFLLNEHPCTHTHTHTKHVAMVTHTHTHILLLCSKETLYYSVDVMYNTFFFMMPLFSWLNNVVTVSKKSPLWSKHYASFCLDTLLVHKIPDVVLAWLA